MLRNRLILLAVIVATGVFASFFGGAVPYALFYLSLMTPVVAFGYNLYVYMRFKLYQSIGSKAVVKGEVAGYSVQLANEDVITYQNLRVDYYSDTSRIYNADTLADYCLTPGEKITMDTSICCNYRGNYPVGIKTVTVTDFLYLFRMVYPIRNRIKVTVLPRIVQLSRLNLLPEEADAKKSYFRLKPENEEMDVEVRPYTRGDSRKQIHWKTSAKRGEIFIRKFTDNPKTGVVLVMDNGLPDKMDELSRLTVEDKVVESALAVADYCLRKRTLCRVYCAAAQQYNIENQSDFETFYELCGRVTFTYSVYADALLEKSLVSGQGYHYVIVTHKLTSELYKQIIRIIGWCSNVSVVLSSDKLSDQQSELAGFISQSGAMVTILRADDEVSAVFQQAV